MYTRGLLYLLAVITFTACDLDEELREDLTGAEAEEFLAAASPEQIEALINGAYNDFNLPFQDQSRYWAAQEHTGDLAIGPTRGGDWDDGGVWRVLHDHTWSADHAFLGDTFTEILQALFSTTNALQFEASMSPDQIAELRFLRAFAVFSIADGWGQVPFREAGEDLTQPSQVLTGEEALAFVISELEASIADLPDMPTNKANKDAARVLLMKAYLNRGTFGSRANPQFPADDMNRVIALADQITGYSLDDAYFDNFAVNNDMVSSENIWTLENTAGINRTNGNTVRSRWFCTLHYNQNPSGWNGFTTLSDFYDTFEEADMRRYAETSAFESLGFNNGFLIGQQFNVAGEALLDRNGNPLDFTRDVALIESGGNLEVTGIRVMKYIPDTENGDDIENDAVIFRYADVLLMKAEAMLRTGREGEATAIVNEIRTIRGASEFAALNLDNLLAERARELYWEGWRRQDLIRFGKFLESWQNKPASTEERLLFAIPAEQVALNPN
ncbi:MAG: RagB/SusD family nutrient uptake outer membrane protein, partial [Bacteroidota bacterium]